MGPRSCREARGEPQLAVAFALCTACTALHGRHAVIYWAPSAIDRVPGSLCSFPLAILSNLRESWVGASYVGFPCGSWLSIRHYRSACVVRPSRIPHSEPYNCGSFLSSPVDCGWQTLGSQAPSPSQSSVITIVSTPVRTSWASRRLQPSLDLENRFVAGQQRRHFKLGG